MNDEFTEYLGIRFPLGGVMNLQRFSFTG